MSEFKNKVLMSHNGTVLKAQRIEEDGSLSEAIDVHPVEGGWDSGGIRLFFNHVREAVGLKPADNPTVEKVEVGGQVVKKGVVISDTPKTVEERPLPGPAEEPEEVKVKMSIKYVTEDKKSKSVVSGSNGGKKKKDKK